jgi:hypothetical protein
LRALQGPWRNPDEEHWFLLAREENEEENGNTSITFKLHSGQRSYIDRISRNKTVLPTAPAANGVDLRQSAKTRMRALVGDDDVSTCNLQVFIRS